MPRKCCVPGCTSNYGDKSSYTTVFRFPKDERTRQKWIRSIHRENFQPSKQSVVCIHHFDPQFILQNEIYPKEDGTVNVIPLKHARLAEGAFPTIFANQPKYMSSEAPVIRKSIETRNIEKNANKKLVEEKLNQKQQILHFNDLVLNYKKKVKRALLLDLTVVESKSCLCFFKNSNVEAGCPAITASLRLKQDLSVELYRNTGPMEKNEYLSILAESKICDTWPKLAKLAELLFNVNADVDNVTSKLNRAIRILKECCDQKYQLTEGTEDILKFVTEQLYLILHVENPKYSSEMLIWSCSFFYSYPSAYAFLRNSRTLKLPHMSYLRRICRCDNLASAGINEAHLKYLSEKLTLLNEEEKLINILFDEIYVKPDVDYKNGKLVGMSSFNINERATTVQTFMLTSVLSKNKDVIGMFPVLNIQAENLKDLLMKVIEQITNAGYTILTLISDNNKINKKAFDLLCDGNMQKTITNKFNGKPIFLLFDTVHLFKNIRNNWLNQLDCEQTFFIPYFKTETNFTIARVDPHYSAKVSNLRTLYFSEQSRMIKLAPNLNKNVLNPNGIQRQNVLLCVKLFDEKNISGLKTLQSESNADWNGTVMFLEIISKWWKVVNCQNQWKGKHLRDPYCEPIRCVNDKNLNFLKQFVMWLKEWGNLNIENVDKRHGKLSLQTQHAILHTCETLICLCEYLLTELKFHYVLLGKFQTDSLEGRFGQYRQMSGGNYHVSVAQILQSEKKIKVVNLLTLKSARCGQFQISDLFSDVNEIDFSNTNDEFINKTFEDIDKHTDVVEVTKNDFMALMYIGGYIVNSLTSKIACHSCLMSLMSDKDVEISTDQNMFYNKNLDRGGLKVPTQYLMDVLVSEYKLFQVLISEIYENIFLNLNNQRLLLCKLCYDSLADVNFESSCSCENAVNTLKKCIMIFSNILLNNFKKHTNDKLNIGSKSKKRKLETLKR